MTNMPAPKIALTAIVLSHNEADNLPRCLEALADCEEVVVVDDGSTDASVQVAEAAGARVVHHPFTSFADQRNWAMQQAGSDTGWTLHLDADEVVTPAGLAEIQSLLPTLNTTQIGGVPRKIILDDRWLKHSADYPVYVPRLVHRDGPRFRMGGHGEIIDAAPETWVYLREPLLHYAFSKGWGEWYAKHERYAQAEAQRIREGHLPSGLTGLFARDRAQRRTAWRAWSYRLPARPWLRFVYAYVWRRGFLDGGPGWKFCRAMMQYERMINRALRDAHASQT